MPRADSPFASTTTGAATVPSILHALSRRLARLLGRLLLRAPRAPQGTHGHATGVLTLRLHANRGRHGTQHLWISHRSNGQRVVHRRPRVAALLHVRAPEEL